MTTRDKKTFVLYFWWGGGGGVGGEEEYQFLSFSDNSQEISSHIQ